MDLISDSDAASCCAARVILKQCVFWLAHRYTSYLSVPIAARKFRLLGLSREFVPRVVPWSSYRVNINDAETRATLERRADATGTRLTLENAQVSLTMVNYAKASYGCVVLQALGPQDFTSHTNNLSVFLPPSTSESHVLRRRARSDPWILAFHIVKDPAALGSMINRTVLFIYPSRASRLSVQFHFHSRSSASPNSERRLSRYFVG